MPGQKSKKHLVWVAAPIAVAIAVIAMVMMPAPIRKLDAFIVTLTSPILLIV